MPFSTYKKIDKKISQKNKSYEFVNKKYKTIHTNSIKNVWRQIRRYFKIYNGVKRNFNLFLSEVLFKINLTCYNKQARFLNSTCKF